MDTIWIRCKPPRQKTDCICGYAVNPLVKKLTAFVTPQKSRRENPPGRKPYTLRHTDNQVYKEVCTHAPSAKQVYSAYAPSATSRINSRGKEEHRKPGRKPYTLHIQANKFTRKYALRHHRPSKFTVHMHHRQLRELIHEEKRNTGSLLFEHTIIPSLLLSPSVVFGTDRML